MAPATLTPTAVPTDTTTADLSTGNTGDTDDGGSGGGIVMIVVIVISVVIAAAIGVTMWCRSKRLKIPVASGTAADPGALTPNPLFATGSSAPVYGSLDPQKVYTHPATSGDQSYAMLQRQDGAAAGTTSVYAEAEDGEGATSVYAIPMAPSLMLATAESVEVGDGQQGATSVYVVPMAPGLMLSTPESGAVVYLAGPTITSTAAAGPNPALVYSVVNKVKNKGPAADVQSEC